MDYGKTCILFLECIVFLLHSGYGTTIHEMKALRHLLFQNYSTDLRPLVNQSKVLNVNISFHLEGITKVDEVNQVLGCNAMFRLRWKDDFLQWNENVYDGFDYLHPFIYQIWHPKLMVINSVGKRELVPGENHPLSVDSHGHVTWRPAEVLQTSCRLDMTWFPFDIQVCEIKILSFQYYSSQVALTAAHDGSLLLKSYVENGVWVVQDSKQTVQTKGNPMLIVSITLKRQSLYFILNIILPVVVISLLNMAVFAIPGESGEKVSTSVTIFLSLSVLMTYVSSLMPRTSYPLSVLTVYLTFVLLTSALTVLVTIMILSVHYTSNKSVPPWLERVVTLTSANMKSSNVLSNEKESASREYRVTWRDVSTSLDYIFFRLFIVAMTITSLVFMLKLTMNDW